MPKRSLDFYSTNTFIYGVSEYDFDIDKAFHDFMSHQENKIVQIHGHRNFYNIIFDKYKYSLNLEGAIEHGGISEF